MDPNLNIPWKLRLFQIRMAIRYLPPNFARLLGVNTHTYQRLEKGDLDPNIATIRRIRLLERAFAEELEVYYKLAKRFHNRCTWGNERKVYEKYGGYAYKKVAVGYRSSNIIPRRQEDIDALGGMGVFRYAQGAPVSVAGPKDKRRRENRAIPDDARTSNKSRFTSGCEVG